MRWRRLVLGGALAAAAVAGLDGGLAFRAQRAGIAEAARNGYPFYDYSLTKHVVAMLVLSVLTVVVATGLSRLKEWPLGALVVIGVTAGPMSVIAAPVRASLVSTFDNTTAWWHLAVGLPQAAILLAATAWTVRALPPAGAQDRDHRRDAAVFAVVTMTALTLQVVTSRGIDQEPGPLVITGWAVLAAGVAVLVRRPAHAWLPAVALTGCGLPPLVMHLAYHRDGGWPGVAGWEIFAQSPVVLSWMTPIVLLTVPALALIATMRSAPASPSGSPAVRDGGRVRPVGEAT